MIKENINRLDFELKSVFQKVQINEGQSKSEYFFDIVAEKIVEGKMTAIRLFINKSQLESKKVTWRYLSNPSEQDSYLVERVSNFEELAEDILQVVDERKFERAYLESLTPVVEKKAEKVQEDNRTNIVKLMEKFDVHHLETKSLVEDHVQTELSYFKHNLRNSDKQRVEMALKSAGLDKFFWNDDKLLIKYYN